MEKVLSQCEKLPKEWQPSQKKIGDIISSTHESGGCIFYNQDISTDGVLKDFRLKRIFFRNKKYCSKFLIYTWYNGELIDTTEHKIKSRCGRKNCISPHHLFKEKCRKRTKSER